MRLIISREVKAKINGYNIDNVVLNGTMEEVFVSLLSEGKVIEKGNYSFYINPQNFSELQFELEEIVSYIAEGNKVFN